MLLTLRKLNERINDLEWKIKMLEEETITKIQVDKSICFPYERIYRHIPVNTIIKQLLEYLKIKITYQKATNAEVKLTKIKARK